MDKIMRDTTERIEKLTNQLLKDNQNSFSVPEQENS